MLIVAACGPSPAAPAPVGGDKPVAGGRIVDGFTSDIKTLQPVRSSDTAC